MGGENFAEQIKKAVADRTKEIENQRKETEAKRADAKAQLGQARDVANAIRARNLQPLMEEFAIGLKDSGVLHDPKVRQDADDGANLFFCICEGVGTGPSALRFRITAYAKVVSVAAIALGVRGEYWKASEDVGRPGVSFFPPEESEAMEGLSPDAREYFIRCCEKPLEKCAIACRDKNSGM
jgi:hypothetical protein